MNFSKLILKPTFLIALIIIFSFSFNSCSNDEEKVETGQNLERMDRMGDNRLLSLQERYRVMMQTQAYQDYRTSAENLAAKMNRTELPALKNMEDAISWYQANKSTMGFASEREFVTLVEEGLLRTQSLVSANIVLYSELARAEIKDIRIIVAPEFEVEPPLTTSDCLTNCGHKWDIDMAVAEATFHATIAATAAPASDGDLLEVGINAAFTFFSIYQAQVNYANALTAAYHGFSDCSSLC